VVKQHGGRYVREGRWPVPARIELSTQLCRVTFDFTHAVITSGVLRIVRPVTTAADPRLRIELAKIIERRP